MSVTADKRYSDPVIEPNLVNWQRYCGTKVFKLGLWLAKAKKYFSKSNNTFVCWFDEVIAYFDNETTSGTVEGINNKFKLIRHFNYGFIILIISESDVD